MGQRPHTSTGHSCKTPYFTALRKPDPYLGRATRYGIICKLVSAAMALSLSLCMFMYNKIWVLKSVVNISNGHSTDGDWHGSFKALWDMGTILVVSLDYWCLQPCAHVHCLAFWMRKGKSEPPSISVFSKWGFLLNSRKVVIFWGWLFSFLLRSI